MWYGYTGKSAKSINQSINQSNSQLCTVHNILIHVSVESTAIGYETRGQSNLTKSASLGAHSPVRGHPRGSKVVPLNSWGRVSY